MVIEEIDFFKKKLEEQLNQKVSYDKIYDTSVKIDKLLIKYYKDKELDTKI
jgi:hypothetical protein